VAWFDMVAPHRMFNSLELIGTICGVVLTICSARCLEGVLGLDLVWIGVSDWTLRQPLAAGGEGFEDVDDGQRDGCGWEVRVGIGVLVWLVWLVSECNDKSHSVTRFKMTTAPSLQQTSSHLPVVTSAL